MIEMTLKKFMPLISVALSLLAGADFAGAKNSSEIIQVSGEAVPEIASTLLLKTPGNPAEEYLLTGKDGILQMGGRIPVSVTRSLEEKDGCLSLSLTLRAEQTIYYNIGQILPTGFSHEGCLFYMPGFWYRKNLRSPKAAPSFHTSDSWRVREDRLSTPLTGVFDEKTGSWYTVLRIDDFSKEALACHTSGEVILSGETSIGYTGFRNGDAKAELVFGFPYQEAPKTYLRKLTLAPAVCAFEKLQKGEEKTLVWEIRKGRSESWSDFVAQVWETSYARLTPEPVDVDYTPGQAKEVLSRYFRQAYDDRYALKHYAGCGLKTATCASNGKAEVGFVGRVLLNAFNAYEYGLQHGHADLVEQAEAVFGSYLEHGFTKGGLLREDVDCNAGRETSVYSIRRQSEGVYAVLNYLSYERKAGRRHPEWEARIRTMLERLSALQNPDGSFPRKFDDNLVVVEPSGGSSSSAVLPFVMAYSYFKDKSYLETARRTADYLETNLIATADYFSSTLDAYCEDKEASLYTSTAMYYMYLTEKNRERRSHYADLCLKSAYFALSWYYLWDVPFAQGQMLGDVGFKSRGWGNVSVENNHIDVFIFEFADVLDFLAREYGKPQFSQFTSVIRTSMLQLMPQQGNMYNIGKEGYYPEVVQHTAWDYGKNGKGFYNDIFAPGWTVASLWQMLSPSRAENFFKK